MNLISSRYDNNSQIKYTSDLFYILICATPRTGSHLLASALYHLKLGIPEEYFNKDITKILCQRWNIRWVSPEDFDSITYSKYLFEKRSTNGVFAFSLFAYQFQSVISNFKIPENALYINIYRKNIIDQLVSLIAMFETKEPFDDGLKFEFIPDIPPISEKLLQVYYHWIIHENTKWNKYLKTTNTISIAYEDLLSSPELVLTQILTKVPNNISPKPIDDAIRLILETSKYSNHSEKKRFIKEKFNDALRRLEN